MRIRQWIFLAHCLAAVLAARAALSLGAFGAASRYVGSRPVGSPAPLPEMRRVAWGVAAASRHVPGATCLTQALAGQYLLARKGLASTIRIGVAHHAGPDLEAHAWLISGNTVVLGGAHHMSRYSRLLDMGP